MGSRCSSWQSVAFRRLCRFLCDPRRFCTSYSSTRCLQVTIRHSVYDGTLYTGFALPDCAFTCHRRRRRRSRSACACWRCCGACLRQALARSALGTGAEARPVHTPLQALPASPRAPAQELRPLHRHISRPVAAFDGNCTWPEPSAPPDPPTQHCCQPLSRACTQRVTAR